MIELVDGPSIVDPTFEFERDDQFVAQSFLRWERSLALLENDSAVAGLIAEFLEAARDSRLQVARLPGAAIVITAEGTRSALRVTGRTAGVLAAYLSGEPVTFQQRAEMTVRRLRIRN
jgi:hypothetical protein